MIKQDLLCRVNADANIGLGHLYRVLAIVEMLKSNFQIHFIVSSTTNKTLIPFDNIITIPNELYEADEADFFAKYYNSSSSVIIFDGYFCNTNYQRRFREKGFKFIVIDDYARDHFYANLVVNHSPFMKPDMYTHETYTKLALGTQYTLLRPSFLKEAKSLNSHDGKLNKLFICFGGADTFNLTIKAVEGAIATNKIKELHVIVKDSIVESEVEDYKNLHPQTKINVYRQVGEDQMIKVIKDCNLAIAPSSTMLFELCCIGIPIISGYFVDNQSNIYKGFLNEGAIYGIGDISKFDASSFKACIEKVMILEGLQEMVEEQKKLIDGGSKERLQKKVEEI